MSRRFKFGAFIVPALLALALTVAACGNDDDNNGANGDDGANGDNASGDTGDAVTEITIEQYDNYFEPDEFTVQAGTTVTVTTVNEGQAAHNLVFKTADAEGQDFESEAFMGAGDEDTFEITVNEPGEYVFQCDYHLPEMVGTLYVVE